MIDLYPNNKHLIPQIYIIGSTAYDHRYIPFESIDLVFTSGDIQWEYFIPTEASFMLHQKNCSYDSVPRVEG